MSSGALFSVPPKIFFVLLQRSDEISWHSFFYVNFFCYLRIRDLCLIFVIMRCETVIFFNDFLCYYGYPIKYIFVWNVVRFSRNVSFIFHILNCFYYFPWQYKKLWSRIFCVRAEYQNRIPSGLHVSKLLKLL